MNVLGCYELQSILQRLTNSIELRVLEGIQLRRNMGDSCDYLDKDIDERVAELRAKIEAQP